MGIPYEAIGIGIGVILGVWAFIEADSVGGRVLVAGLMVAIFLVPIVWRTPAGHLASFIAWVVFGVGCYLFIKLHGIPLR